MEICQDRHFYFGLWTFTLDFAEVPRLFVSFNWCRRGQRGEKVLSEEELGAMEARDFAPEGQHFFKIFGRRLIVRRTFVISLSSISVLN